LAIIAAKMSTEKSGKAPNEQVHVADFSATLKQNEPTHSVKSPSSSTATEVVNNNYNTTVASSHNDTVSKADMPSNGPTNSTAPSPSQTVVKGPRSTPTNVRFTTPQKSSTPNTNRGAQLVNGELHPSPGNHSNCLQHQDLGRVVRNSPGRDSDSDTGVITPNLSPSLLRAHLRPRREHSSSSMSEVESEMGDLDLGEMSDVNFQTNLMARKRYVNQNLTL
jgi:hypothetical protein